MLTYVLLENSFGAIFNCHPVGPILVFESVVAAAAVAAAAAVEPTPTVVAAAVAAVVGAASSAVAAFSSEFLPCFWRVETACRLSSPRRRGRR